jgi:tetratricopeptide (TPR) repeat protein
LEQSRAPGCQVVHIHGYWHGTDTLHTGNRLRQPRPALKASMLRHLENKTIVVLGYGGWPDIFTEALAELCSDTSRFPELIWCLYGESPRLGTHLSSILQSGAARNRVTFYAGIDCHVLLPRLVEEWSDLVAGQTPSDDRGAVAELPRLMGPQKFHGDRPPTVGIWVGRDAELAAMRTSSASVLSISGIGGQGKSALAAIYLKEVDDGLTSFSYWDWRDCREEGDRFRTQLIAVIERVSDGRIVGAALADANDKDIVDVFFDLIDRRPGVFVFDNVDHHIDLENRHFVGLIDDLVKRFLSTTSGSRLILTARPSVHYESAAADFIQLTGLSVEEAEELFTRRASAVAIEPRDIELAHKLTDGHAFWLNLIAAKAAKGTAKDLQTLLDDIRRGRGETPDVLSSVWDTLGEREQLDLRAMAETVRSETQETIEDIVSGQIHYAKFVKTLNSLISLNLVVVKPQANSPDLFDLHPLVRQFIRRNFARVDRVDFIKPLLRRYETIVTAIEGILGVHLPFSMLERWSQKAELEIEAGMNTQAFATLHKASDALRGAGHLEEFVRIGRRLFESVNWDVSGHLKHFDAVLEDLIGSLEYLGRVDDAEDLLRLFEQSVPAKTSRYIRYCDIRCYSYWIRGEYERAIEWGQRGQDLVEASTVDTGVDCRYNLGLALRDGGHVDRALEYFRKTRSVDDIINSSDHDTEISAPDLGNVGRCLQLQGRLDGALRCYRRSAALLEKEDSGDRASNQAFARQWIAEILAKQGDLALARSFYLDAETILRTISPRRAQLMRDALSNLGSTSEAFAPSSRSAARRRVEQWIAGRQAAVSR